MEATRTYRVLIVEDDRSIARAIVRALVSLGYDVAGIAATGDEAVRLAEQARPDLVLVDSRQQGLAQSLSSRLHVAIALLTAHAETELVDEAARIVALNHGLAERERAQLRRLEALGRLAGGIAHDLNNVLTVILPACRSLLARLPAGSVEHGQAAVIRSAADRGARMTRQLMTFGRRQEIEQVPCDLGAIVNGVTMIFVQLVGDAVSLSTEIAPGLPCIEASASELEQLLFNLVANARDAIAEVGAIRIAIDHDDQHVRLSVSDTGHGMDEATRVRMFEPFFTTRASDMGSGLGLATVYAIVKRHRGTIEVTSAPGAGTTVSIRFPSVAIPAISMPMPDHADASIRLQGMALVVENDDVVRASVRDILAASGMRVVEARDGVHAIELAGSLPAIDVVVSDVVMPRMSALELAQHLAHIRPGIRFVYISGYPEGSVPGAHYDVLAPVLHKPFTPRALLERVRVVMQS